jgi:FtsP/CotA-like multicopper oxidase with cupredoxin domain
VTEAVTTLAMKNKTDYPGQAAREVEPSRPSLSRRQMLVKTGAALGSGALALRAAQAEAADVPGGQRPRAGSAAASDQPQASQRTARPGRPGRDYQPVVIPNGTRAPWTIVSGVKVFHMVAEEVEHEFAPGLTATCWGYNGAVHGPTLEWVEGERVRIYVTNRLDAPTTIHWHGILLPNGMDGVGGLNQRAIRKGETFKYEFTVRQSGTGMYHSHHDEMTQIGMGMTGIVVIHPRDARAPRVDRDFVLLLHEWRVDVGTSRPNPNEMTDFNLLTINGKVFPGTEPLVVKTGERVRIRIGNLSAMDHHPIHLHGYQFRITETDGGRIAAAGQWPETTVLVPVGSTRTIEFVADEPGDWALHCHMTHHVMNQMGHDLPNMIGMRPGNVDQRVRSLLPNYMTMGQEGMGDMAEMGMAVPKNSLPMVGAPGKHDYITMGGMFTVLKVRDQLTSYRDPGWYENPPGTLAQRANPEELLRDGIDPASPPKAERGGDA